MELLDFLNSHPTNWKEKLAAKPYCLSISYDRDYWLFKYSLIESNLSLPICREARGCICRKNDNGEWICVCRSLDKFGNWGESYADTKKINWSAGVDVQQKVDGSIIRLWYDRNYWHVSTNGKVDAFTAECGDTTYGNAFKMLVQEHRSWNDFLSTLDTRYTYWFELVSQYNPIVVRYTNFGIYYLGARNMETMEEDGHFIESEMEFCNGSWLKFPQHYHYNSLNEVVEACHQMGEDEEGYVCVSYSQMENGSFLRIKCKGDEYLKRHKLRGNGPLTAGKIIEFWQTDSLDDFLAYFPEHTNFVDSVLNKLTNLIEKADIAYDCVKDYGPRRDFALRAQSYIKPIQSFLFARLDNKVNCANTYFKNMKPRNLAELLDVKEISVK